MTLSELKELIPILHLNNALSLKLNKDGIELLFKETVPQKVSIQMPSGKIVTAQGPDETPIQTVTSQDAPIPTDSLEQEKGMSFDQLLNWSAGSDEFSVPGTNDQFTNDTPLEDPKINGSISG